MFAEYGVLNYWTYLVGAIFIVLVPGPNTLFVLKNSVSSGMKGGYLAACGVFIGDAVLMFLAWAGVATLIKTTPILFNIVRYLGAFYLLYLGSKILYATLKGKRAMTDFEYELQQADLNYRLDNELESIFVMSAPQYGYISSSVVRQIASLGSDVSTFVPSNVVEALKHRFS